METYVANYGNVYPALPGPLLSSIVNHEPENVEPYYLWLSICNSQYQPNRTDRMKFYTLTAVYLITVIIDSLSNKNIANLIHF